MGWTFGLGIALRTSPTKLTGRKILYQQDASYSCEQEQSDSLGLSESTERRNVRQEVFDENALL